MVKIVQTLIVRNHTSGTLLPLADLIQRMRLKDIVSWRLREIKLYGSGRPFGMSFDDFETASRAAANGIAVSDQEFQVFLQSDVQVIDGVIEAYSGDDPATFVVRIDCEDATQWEITTDLPEIVKNLEQPDL